MPNIQIRPTVAADLTRLMALDHSIQSEAVWQLELRRESGQTTAVFREVRLPRSISVAYPRNPFALADEWARRSMMFTALTGAEPAGYISLLERGMDSLSIVADLVVHAAHRRRGVGSALLSAAHEWSAAKGLRRVVFETQSKNLPAIRLAQKLGYEFCGYNDQYYLTQDVTLFFCRALKSS